MIRTSKGECCPDYPTYLGSAHWLWFRWHILTEVQAHCSDCGGRIRLQVHHLTYERIGHELDSDVVVLCADCHSARHGKHRDGQPLSLAEGLDLMVEIIKNRRGAA